MKLLAIILAAVINPGNAFLEPLQPRDSILVGDQLRYGFQLTDVAEGTPLLLPEFQPEKDAPLDRVEKDIKRAMELIAFCKTQLRGYKERFAALMDDQNGVDTEEE